MNTIAMLQNTLNWNFQHREMALGDDRHNDAQRYTNNMVKLLDREPTLKVPERPAGGTSKKRGK